MKQLRVSSKLLLISASLVSTVVSFIGGLIMHLESLDVIERVAEEVAGAESFLAQQVLQMSFKEVAETSESTDRLFRMWHPFTDYREIMEWSIADGFARLTASKTMWGTGMIILGGSPAQRSVRTNVWWDPLTDPGWIEQVGGERFFLSAYYLPELWQTHCGRAEGEPNAGAECNMVFGIDAATGYRYKNLYNYSANWQKWQALYLQDNAPQTYNNTGLSFYRMINVWKSIDETPYLFVTKNTVAPAMQDYPLTQDAVTIHLISFSFHTWSASLRDLNLTGLTIAVTLPPDLGEGQIVARNDGVPLAEKGCAPESRLGQYMAGCRAFVKDSGQRLWQAVEEANKRKDGVFCKLHLDGQEHWLLRQTLFSPGPLDELDEMILLWIRPTSDTEDEVHRSLMFFVAFIVSVVVFDGFVVLLEVTKIARPLSTIAKAMAHIELMDLERAREDLGAERLVAQRLGISDIIKLVETFTKTLEYLMFYRDFLPQACLQEAPSAGSSSKGVVPTPKLTPQLHVRLSPARSLGRTEAAFSRGRKSRNGSTSPSTHNTPTVTPSGSPRITPHGVSRVVFEPAPSSADSDGSAGSPTGACLPISVKCPGTSFVQGGLERRAVTVAVFNIRRTHNMNVPRNGDIADDRSFGCTV
eukprot:Hpha_TRINITY_DN9371_c0_g1::TRINITY_DN9371_c0_g1_i1::g.26015::m.26015